LDNLLDKREKNREKHDRRVFLFGHNKISSLYNCNYMYNIKSKIYKLPADENNKFIPRYVQYTSSHHVLISRVTGLDKVKYKQKYEIKNIISYSKE